MDDRSDPHDDLASSSASPFPSSADASPAGRRTRTPPLARDDHGPDQAHRSRPRRIALAQRLLAARLRWDAAFDPLVFSSPARDMLLDLYVAGEDGRSVLDASLSAGVPQSAALRWLTYLKRQALIIETSRFDVNGQTSLRLTDQARRAVEHYLDALCDPDSAG
jgi:hypothetical protein